MNRSICCKDIASIIMVEGQFLIGEGMKSAKVNKMSEFILTYTLADETAEKTSDVVECQFKSLANGSTVKCRVDQIDSGEYRIQYTPTIRGRHELTVTVNGQEITGSPFPVFVSIHPTQLCEPVRVVSEISKPMGIAVNSAGQIITRTQTLIAILDRNGKIVLLDENGKKRLAGFKDVKNILYLVVDNTDCITATVKTKARTADDDTELGSKIIKLGPNLEVIAEVSCNGSTLFGITLVGEKVMVCDIKNKRIMVYTKELKYVKEIVSPGKFGAILDLSSDEHGNLYISDNSKSCIHVLSNCGEFLRSFGCDGNLKKRLKGPSGICVAGQYVYVGDVPNKCVSVFTTEGEYVTSFGPTRPWGVFVDKDGFLYVSSTDYDKIHVF